MPYYGICTLDREKHIFSAEDVVVAADHDALSRALELVDDQHSAEVWGSNRLVGKLAAPNRAE